MPDFLEILTDNGWLELSKFRMTYPIHLCRITPDQKVIKETPYQFSKYFYDGPLLEIETDHCTVYLKPSSYVITDKGSQRAEELTRGDQLVKYHMSHKIEKINHGVWKGNVCSFKFNSDNYLPIKFEKDYILIV